MKLIQFIKQSPYKRPLKTGLIIIILAFLLSLGSITYSFFSARKTVKTFQIIQKKSINGTIGWQNTEIQKLWKEKLWMESQLLTSKEDSMSLSINLQDSLLLLQFKGLTLVKTKIGFKFPEKFLQDIDATTYAMLFGHPETILSERANIAKKPFHKVNVSQASDTTAFLKKAKQRMFSWSFITDNNIRVVIHGFNPLQTNIYSRTDMLKFRIKTKIFSPFAPYRPTLFIWINNKDATDIYRALPIKAKVIILD